MPVSDRNFANDVLNSLRLYLELRFVNFARVFAYILNTSETALGMIAAFRQRRLCYRVLSGRQEKLWTVRTVVGCDHCC